jgi:ADP-heptose:LPS heptosyltransferase
LTLKTRIDNSIILKRILLVLLENIFRIIRFLSKKQYKQNNSIAIISLHKLGDTVFTIPAIKEFVTIEQAQLIIICFQHSEVIYRQVFDSIDYLILEQKEFKYNGRIASAAARKKLNKLSLDAIIDLTGSIVSASLIFSSNCNKICGINENYFKGIYNNFKTIRINPHQIDIYFDAISTFNNKLTKDFNAYPIAYKHESPILIQPFAGWLAKEWNLNKFISLYYLISAQHKCFFILPKGSVKPDVLLELSQEKIGIIQCDSIETLITEIKNCSLFISNDSGPLQIAALLGKPTFCIYGPTNPAFHKPLGDYHKFINKTLKCSPTSQKYCLADGGDSCPHHDCLNLLTVDDVFSRINKFIIELKLSYKKEKYES